MQTSGYMLQRGPCTWYLSVIYPDLPINKHTQPVSVWKFMSHTCSGFYVALSLLIKLILLQQNSVFFLCVRFWAAFDNAINLNPVAHWINICFYTNSAPSLLHTYTHCLCFNLALSSGWSHPTDLLVMILDYVGVLPVPLPTGVYGKALILGIWPVKSKSPCRGPWSDTGESFRLCISL